MARNFRLYDRILIVQPSTGSILDFAPDEVRQDLGRSFQEDTQQMDDGSTWRRSQANSITVPLLENEQLNLARAMIRQDCPCFAIGLGLPGTRNLGFFEEAQMRLVPEDNGSVSMAADTLVIKTSARYPDIADSDDLTDPLPWRGADETRVGLTGIGVLDIYEFMSGLTSTGPANTDLYGVVSPDIIDPTTNTTRFTLSLADNAQGIAHDGSILYVTNDDSANSGSSIITVNPDGTNETETAYHDQTVSPTDVTHNRALNDLYVVVTETDSVEAIGDSSLGTLERTVLQDASNPPFTVASINGELYVGKQDGTLEVWDATTSSETLIETYSLGSQPILSSFHRGTLLADVGGDGFNRYRFHGLVNQGSWRGRYWLTPGPTTGGASISPDLVGDTLNVDASNTAIAYMIFPAWQAGVEVTFPQGGSGSGDIRARAWDGNILSSVTVGNTLTIPDKTWALEIELTGATEQPEVHVTDTGTIQGPLPGQSVSDCDSRATSPSWL